MISHKTEFMRVIKHKAPYQKQSSSYTRYFAQALSFNLLIVAGHFAEHLIQMYQLYVLHMHPKLAGGILGLYFPQLAQNEVLHIAYNSLQLMGLLVLLPGFLKQESKAKLCWRVAIVAQSWHFFEHVLLQVQYLTGQYLFGALHQKSLLEFLFPRAELHFTYNLLAFTPTLIAVCLYFWHKRTNE